MQGRLLIYYANMLAVILFFPLLSNCAGMNNQTQTATTPPTSLQSKASFAVKMAIEGMVPYKTDLIDLYYPKGWTLKEIKGNPVLKAKIAQPLTDTSITVFCLNEAGFNEKEVIDILKGAMLDQLPTMSAVSSKQLTNGAKYQVFEGHFSAKGEEIEMKALIGWNLEGNKCGYGMFGVIKSQWFPSFSEGAIATLQTSK